MDKLLRFITRLMLVVELAASTATVAADSHARLQLAPSGTRFQFEVIESHDAVYLGDTPGHMGRNGGLTVRPNVALGDGVFRTVADRDVRVGTITRAVWDRVSGGLTVEFDPEPMTRVAVGEEVWIDLNPPMPAETVSSRTAAEGVYRVTLECGADEAASVTTCKGESRRLFVLGERVPQGGRTMKTFLVDVHRAEFPGGRVSLKERELGSANWDDRLTLEFLGAPPGVRSVSVEPVASDAAVTRIFLAGDSTVTDQAREPYAGWGQMLPVFFGPEAVVANHAESGLALGSFRGGRRLDKILAQLRPGDFVLIQFGHNDQKVKDEAAGAFAGYAALLGEFVERIRVRGGRPVLVTSVARRRFDEAGQVVESLGDFPEAVRRVAKENEVPLIDLNAMSKRLYQALGVEGSRAVFLHLPAGTHPGQDEPLADDTHFSTYGAYEIARCVVEGIRRGVPDLAALLAAEVQPFDPEHPDQPDTVAIPASPFEGPAVPDGR